MTAEEAKAEELYLKKLQRINDKYIQNDEVENCLCEEPGCSKRATFDVFPDADRPEMILCKEHAAIESLIGSAVYQLRNKWKRK